MSYESIDPTIFCWAKKHTLYVGTNYKDEEVRSVDVVSAKGERFQIWFERPLGSRVVIHAWNYKKTKREWVVEITDLQSVLEEVFQTVKSWMQQ